MNLNIAREIASMQRSTVKELRMQYAAVCGEATLANNKAWLIKRIAWRLQAKEEGDLSERARRRAAELANDADLRLSPPRPREMTATSEALTTTTAIDFKNDRRLPPPGTVISRVYKGQTLQVRILPDGFEFEGEVYSSLSAVAKHVTG